jgi:hypothetical protein
MVSILFLSQELQKDFFVFTIGAGIIEVENNDAFVPWKKFTHRPKRRARRNL